MGRRVMVRRRSGRIPQAVPAIVGRSLVHRRKLRVEGHECRRKLQRAVSDGSASSSVGGSRCRSQPVRRSQPGMMVGGCRGQRMARMVERMNLHVLVEGLFFRHFVNNNRAAALHSQNKPGRTGSSNPKLGSSLIHLHFRRFPKVLSRCPAERLSLKFSFKYTGTNSRIR